VKEKLSTEVGSGRLGLGVGTGQLKVGAGVGEPVSARETCSSVGICVEKSVGQSIIGTEVGMAVGTIESFIE
jgi:hypothetical protein